MWVLALILISLLIWQLSILNIIKTSLVGNSEPISKRAVIFHIAALIYSPERDQFYKRAYASMKEAATNNGSALQLFEYTKTQSIEEIRSLLHLVRDIGPDGFIISLPSLAPFETEINEIASKGIPVVSYEMDALSGKHLAHVGTNPFELGKLAGIAITNRFKGPQHIGLLLALGNGYGTTRNASFVQGLTHSIRENPEMAITLISTVKDPQIGAETFLKDIIKAEPVMDIVVCTTARDTEGISQALVDLGRVGKPAIIGFDDSQAVISLLEEGVVSATVSRNPETGGKIAVETLIALIQNERTNAYQDPGASLLYSENIQRKKR